MADTVDLLEDDEIDMLSAPVLPRVDATLLYDTISAPSTLAQTETGETRRSTRQRKIPEIFREVQLNHRKRTHTASTGPAKKQKLDEKKAKTSLVHEKKAERDICRSHWLSRHRKLFEPLLPHSSTFFENLRTHKQLPKGKSPYTPFHEFEEQPKLINKSAGLMKDYQLHGLSFLVYMYKNGMNCILGDEMGLGKTLQTLSLLAYISETTNGPLDPHLIICPLSVLSSWESEIARWLPSMTVVRFHGSANERLRLRNTLRDSKYDIIVTTYDAFVVDNSWFKTRRWTYCVLDEGHKIKNAKTNIAHDVQHIGAMYRLILTGTPVQNNLVELWSLLHFLYPTVFTPASEKLFNDSFDIGKGSYSLPFVNATKKLLSVIMLRRTKATVDINVPLREEQTVFIPLTEAQRFWTYHLLTKLNTVDLDNIFNVTLDSPEGIASEGRNEVLSLIEDQVAKGVGKEGKQWMKLMNLLLQLRRVCDHPYLLTHAEPDPYYIGEHIVASSSKLIAIDKILADILPKGERVLIFSQWTRMLDVLEDMMHLRSIKYARLDGSTQRPRRNLDIKLFQHENSPFQVYLISTKAGGLGISLTKASTVIMADSDWNPQNDLQAIARAHRIGQKKIVKVYRLICGGSVEDQMLDRIRRKLFLSVKLMGSDNTGSTDTGTMKYSELMDILRKGSSALVRSGDGMDLAKFIQAPISEILDTSKSRENARDAKMMQEIEANGVKNEEEVDSMEKLIHDAEEEERQLLSGVAQVRCRLFEGTMVEAKGGSGSGNKNISEEWNQAQKRVRVNNTVVIGGMTFILDPPSEAQPMAAQPPPKKAKKASMDSEDFCINCLDGGELVCCAYCPRVFHASCRGLSKQQVKSQMIACDQHACWQCSRRTADAGGMLFRCRTCPRAFCEDCLPEPYDPVGETLPEFLILNCGEQNSAYYIECKFCKEQVEEDSAWWKDWQDDFKRAEKKVEEMDATLKAQASTAAA